MELISLLSLVVVIAVGVITSKNIGMLALATALVLGVFGGLTSNDIIAGFPTGLFIYLTGMFFFFSIAKLNGSLELLSKKVFLKMARVKLIFPLIVFVVSALITSIDPGGLTSYVVLLAIAMGIGFQKGFSPVLIGIITILGSNATFMTPVGVFGSIASSLMQANAYPNFSPQLVVNGILMFGLGAILAYIAFRGWKLNGSEVVSLGVKASDNGEDVPAFNRHQVITLFG